jgi:hypothetical protein
MKLLDNRVKTARGLTRQAIRACQASNIEASSIDPVVLQSMRNAARETAVDSLRALVRVLYDRFKDFKGCQMHLAVLFQTSRSTICRTIQDPDLGTRAMGRPPILNSEEENGIVDYVRAEQRAGRCYTVSEIADWVNKNLLTDGRWVSDRFLLDNSFIMSKLKAKCPQKVDSDRIDASVYTNFIDFFTVLQSLMDTHHFDPDLIINMDETKVSTSATKNAVKVMYDEKISLPTSAYEPLDDHITFSCSVSASGRRLLPVFIMKNKTLACEKILRTAHFEYGDFGMQHSCKGWQDAVRIVG